MTLFTILICCSRKKVSGVSLHFTIKALTYKYVPVALAHFTHSASIVWNRKTERSLVRGRGTSVGNNNSLDIKAGRPNTLTSYWDKAIRRVYYAHAIYNGGGAYSITLVRTYIRILTPFFIASSPVSRHLIFTWILSWNATYRLFTCDDEFRAKRQSLNSRENFRKCQEFW